MYFLAIVEYDVRALRASMAWEDGRLPLIPQLPVPRIVDDFLTKGLVMWLLAPFHRTKAILKWHN
jgi:hypothetical protein